MRVRQRRCCLLQAGAHAEAAAAALAAAAPLVRSLGALGMLGGSCSAHRLVAYALTTAERVTQLAE